MRSYSLISQALAELRTRARVRAAYFEDRVDGIRVEVDGVPKLAHIPPAELLPASVHGIPIEVVEYSPPQTCTASVAVADTGRFSVRRGNGRSARVTAIARDGNATLVLTSGHLFGPDAKTGDSGEIVDIETPTGSSRGRVQSVANARVADPVWRFADAALIKADAVLDPGHPLRPGPHGIPADTSALPAGAKLRFSQGAGMATAVLGALSAAQVGLQGPDGLTYSYGDLFRVEGYVWRQGDSGTLLFVEGDLAALVLVGATLDGRTGYAMRLRTLLARPLTGAQFAAFFQEVR